MMAKEDINSANGCDEVDMNDANVEKLKTWIVRCECMVDELEDLRVLVAEQVQQNS